MAKHAIDPELGKPITFAPVDEPPALQKFAACSHIVLSGACWIQRSNVLDSGTLPPENTLIKYVVPIDKSGVTLAVFGEQYNSVNAPQLPLYTAWSKLVVPPVILINEINCTSFNAVNWNQTSSSGFPAHDPVGTPVGVAAKTVPGVVTSQVDPGFTTATVAPVQLSFAGGHAATCIGELLMTQFTSWSLEIVIMIGVANG